jgi:hypothetical protein
MASHPSIQKSASYPDTVVIEEKTMQAERHKNQPGGVMAQKRYQGPLTEDEETTLHAIINKRKHGAQKRKRAQAPLPANEEHTDEAAAERADMSVRGIEDLRKRFVENGFESSLEG